MSERITVRELIKRVKLSKNPEMINYIGDVYKFQDGDYIKQTDRGSFAQILSKYPELLLLDETIIEIL